MYVRSLKQAKRSGAAATAATATASSGGEGTASAPSVNIWSAIALQRHYASMVPRGILPGPPPPMQQHRQQQPQQQPQPPTQSASEAPTAPASSAMAVGSGRNAVRSVRRGGGPNVVPLPPSGDSSPLGQRIGTSDAPPQALAANGRGRGGRASGRGAAPNAMGRSKGIVSVEATAAHSPAPPPASSSSVPITAPAITRGGVAVSAAGGLGAVHTSRREQEAAARLGLIELPPPPPTAADWESFVGQAAARGREGGVGHHACPICLERFMADAAAPLVILSCTHVFHKTCLAQMEKFVARARERVCCPLCRKGNYYKRPLVEGRAQLADMAATKIQSWVRGRRARRAYLRLRLKANPQFRSDFAFAHLSRISDYYLTAATAREKEVDEMLERLDLQRQKAMADLMTEADWDEVRMQILRRAWEPNTEATAVQQKKRGSPSKRKNTKKKKREGAEVSDGGGGNAPHSDDFEPLDDGGSGSDASFSSSPSSAASSSADSHCGEAGGGGVECPICMGDIVSEATGDCDPLAVMLSCSHAFHGPCLDAFERMGGGGGASGDNTTAERIPRCAVCRKGYARRPLIDTR